MAGPFFILNSDTLFETVSYINRNRAQLIESHPISIALFVAFILVYLTSSKSTIIHYQCVSTGCCVHVARIKINIDNQRVTKPMQRYDILPEQPKEKA